MDVATPLLLTATSDGRPLAHDATGIDTSAMRQGGCVSYSIDLDRALEDDDIWSGAQRVGHDALLSPDLWLWPPQPRDVGMTIRARFELPDSMTVALPWPMDDDTYPYVIPESAFVWKSGGALGRMKRHPFTMGDGTIDVAVLGGGFDDDALVLGWVKRWASAVAALLGGFPARRSTVLLVPKAAGASSFGFVVQGGGPLAVLMMARDIDAERVAGEWTGVHELLHFSLPPILVQDAWLFEGMTTYLATVARARSGLITESFAWWELLDGFERGSRVGTGKTLRAESATMHDNHTYWRVYWSGAAIAWAIDVELHKAGTSLAETIGKLAKSRPDAARSWTGEDVVAELAQMCGSDVPGDIVARHLDAKDFPDVRTLARSLGVSIAARHRAVFDDRAVDAEIRRAIMRAPTASASTEPTPRGLTP
jgi:hypothetical protein